MSTMSEPEARAEFAAARSARLATADADGRPHLVPITFEVDEGRVYFAIDDAKPKSAARLRRLRNIEANPRVCVLADEYDEDWEQLWWVRADGDARVLDGERERRRVGELLAAKYPQYTQYARLGGSRAAAAESADTADAGVAGHAARSLGLAVAVGPVVEISVTKWSGWRFRATR